MHPRVLLLHSRITIDTSLALQILYRKYIVLVLMMIGLSFCITPQVYAHKFYLSLTEIRCNVEKGTVEISMRIFPDDLDRAIEEIWGVNPQIVTQFEHRKADEWISDYLYRNFRIWINGESIHYEYLGKTPESDAVYCFLEAPLTASPVEIIVENRLLTEVFEDQRNIVQVYYGKYNRGALLDRYHPKETFTK